MMESLQISTGEKRIPITRDGQSVGELVFNPSDAMFAEKFYKIFDEFKTTLTEYQARYDALEKDSDDAPVDTEAGLRLIHDTCVYVREKIDYVFGAGTSQIVFGDVLKMDIFYQFFDGVLPFIKAARNEKLASYLVHPKKRKPRTRK